MDGWNTRFLLGWPYFWCYVSFREGTCFSEWFHIGPIFTYVFPTLAFCLIFWGGVWRVVSVYVFLVGKRVHTWMSQEVNKWLVNGL